MARRVSFSTAAEAADAATAALEPLFERAEEELQAEAAMGLPTPNDFGVGAGCWRRPEQP